MRALDGGTFGCWDMSPNNRLGVERMLFRLRTGMPWQDLPEVFGPWQTVWKRHRRYAADGTWDRVLVALTAVADATGNLGGLPKLIWPPAATVGVWRCG